tara:strand:- start:9071 stop:10018 length:948 start_codon:yes stop_codon:yes gene_type:complete
MLKKAIIFGLKGTKLTANEKYFLAKYKPWGVILFSRNIKNLYQLKFLINDIKNIFRDKNYPILIDQEGGRVSRLNKILDFSLFSQEFFAKLYSKDKNFFFHNYSVYINSVCQILKTVGININTVPVLDLKFKNSSQIIGDRSFSYNPKTVSKMGNICIDLYKKNKIATVIKHIPGHGRAKSDSHFKTPTVDASKKELIGKDFKPFQKNTSLFAMTAHVLYKSYDSKHTCTHSSILINKVVRKHINFDGILISDDISMKALKLGLKENAIKALNAGCNLILHCNGNINEMNELIKVIPNIDKFIQKKTAQFYKFLG